MNNNEPNKIVNRIYKQYRLMIDYSVWTDCYPNYETAKERLSVELADITKRTGAIEVMSKSCILKLSAMMSSWRFMAIHSFLIYLAKGIERD